MRRHSLLLMAVALSLGSAPAPLPGPKADLRKMQGTWVLAYFADGSETFPAGVRVTVAGNRVTYAYRHGDIFARRAFTLDATRSPKTIDLRGTGGTMKGQVDRGVYRLEADTLTICYGVRPGLPRPAVVEGGSGYMLEVWKRLKR